ncbi:MAG: type II secretion system F family protein [Micrococcaceae bacterium]|uniref:type II secretion system F family protein n=1 Tax=Arthrobacter sp. 179 TaxID=3457734 RepID=UPI00264CE551|nr:type II secretion system F family protein [Micrococcaceae bacterium]MDN5880215.1 type II secretion system F family protein [Micrococcaceae bacterium]MDN5887651.1 type II secretion system F family protein [Micrococcaceae bacterium]MDN6169267.1 type II secretion system F family protein [Micrococcaceae bacterium]MDN6177740.1 type II secretion system F family protein [Micrococcaceae bacterium]
MTLVWGLVLGLGLLLVWQACWSEPAKPAKPRKRRIQALLLRAGLDKVSVAGFMSAMLLCFVIVAVIVFVVTLSPLIAPIFGAFGALVPMLVVRWRAAKRAMVLREQWPDVVDHLRSAIRAGLSLPEALMQLGVQGPEQLRPAFTEFGLDYRATSHFVDAMERLRYRLADPVADKIVAALMITREVGGSDLGEMLGTLGGFLRDSARTRGELEARQSWTVNAARLAVAAPWVILLLMASQPQAVKAYSTVGGAVVLLGGLFISFLCYRIMLGIGTLPSEERILK